jgi:hypothetical protein
MNNKPLCEKMGCWLAFNRDEAPVHKPTWSEWLEASAHGHNATGVLTLTCPKCGTSSDRTSFNKLQKGGGIACGCVNKTERTVWFPELLRQCAEHGYEALTGDVGYYSPSHLRRAPETASRRFDGGVRVGRVSVSEECDGGQHFRDIDRFNSTAAETQGFDGAKVRSGLRAGEWNVRYYQEGVWTHAYQWKTFMRNAHAYVARHETGAPRVILPDAYCREYDAWLSGAGIESLHVVWL